MGIVYRAREESLRRLVAVKVVSAALAQDPDFVRRFEREAQLAASIEHPSVVPIYAAGEERGRLYLVMRYVAGTDLANEVATHGRLEAQRVAAIARALGGALDAAHARGLVHRDVKPANVPLTGSDADEHSLLTDFGLSKEASSQTGLTATGHWLGTLDYAAPEQLDGRALDARADVYSLGCLLYECLSGRVPFEGTPAAKLFAHAHTAPPSLGEIGGGRTAELDTVLSRAMAKDPADRPPSAGDLGRAVVAAVDGRPETLPERSVATGQAAGAVTQTDAPAYLQPTVLGDRRQRVQHAPRAPAVPRVDPPTPSPPPAGRRRLGPLVGVGLAILVVGLGAAAAIALLSREDAPAPPASAETAPAEDATSDTIAEPPEASSSQAIEPPLDDATPSSSGDWPLDRSAYIVVLRSTGTREAAEATSAGAASMGLEQPGVLNSSDFASLRPGYWVAYSGVASSQAEASLLADSAREADFEEAYVRFVSTD